MLYGVADDVPTGGDPRRPDGPPSAPPRPFLVRTAAVLVGLTLLVIVEVGGAAFYLAWALIVLALLSEGAASIVYLRRSHRGRGA